MMFSDLNLLSSAFVPVVLILQILAIVAFFGGLLAVLWYASIVWRRKGGFKATWKAKTWSVLLVISALTVLWIALVYHLVGLTTQY